MQQAYGDGSAQTTCADFILSKLSEAGIDIVFGIPGVHNIEFYRTFPDHPLRHVTPRHEQGAGFMAYGYAFATGRPACCMLITGPGLLNAATAIAEAHSDSLPMLVVTSGNQRSEIAIDAGRLHANGNQHVLEREITAIAHLVLDEANIVEMLERSFAAFATQRPRPISIQLPRDLADKPIRYTAKPASAYFKPVPSDDAIAEAARMLSAAENPIMILGGGAIDATDAARELAEILALPVLTTTAGKGILPETHPLSLGASLPFKAVQERVAAADVVLAAGTQLAENDTLYSYSSYRIGGRLIRIDLDPNQLAANHPATLGIHGDARAALQAITADNTLPAADDVLTSERHLEVQSLLKSRDGQWARGADRHIAILDALWEALADDAIICADSTQLAYTGNHYYRSLKPRTWLFPNGYGTLGSALPAAIGAKLGCTDRQVVAIVGDGSLLYTVEELVTAVENGIGLPIIVWNNASYGEIRDAMQDASIPTIGVNLHTPDLSRLAEGFGCQAIQLDRADGLRRHLANAFAASVPTLIEIDAKAIT